MTTTPITEASPPAPAGEPWYIQPATAIVNRYIEETGVVGTGVADFTDDCVCGFSVWLHNLSDLSSRSKQIYRSAVRKQYGFRALTPRMLVAQLATADLKQASVEAYVQTCQRLWVYGERYSRVGGYRKDGLHTITVAELTQTIFVASALTGLPYRQLLQSSHGGARTSRQAENQAQSEDSHQTPDDIATLKRGHITMKIIVPNSNHTPPRTMELKGLTDYQYFHVERALSIREIVTSTAQQPHTDDMETDRAVRALYKAVEKTISRYSGLTMPCIRSKYPLLLGRVVLPSPSRLA